MFFYTQLPELMGGGMCDIPHAKREVNVPGLFLIHDFISPKEEEAIVKELD